MPEEETNVTNDQKNKSIKKKKKAVDAIIKEDGQNREITIKYDDGSVEEFTEEEKR